MKLSLFISLPITCAVVSGASALNLWASSRQIFRSPAASLQQPFGQPNIVMPPSNDASKDQDVSTGVIISDVIGKVREAAIFSGLTRDINTVSDRLDDSAQNATVLAPTNEAMKSLPRKPWQDPQEYENLGSNAYVGTEGEDRAQRNMQRFVEAHVVPTSPWEENQKVKTLAGNEVWYEVKDGKKIVSF